MNTEEEIQSFYHEIQKRIPDINHAIQKCEQLRQDCIQAGLTIPDELEDGIRNIKNYKQQIEELEWVLHETEWYKRKTEEAEREIERKQKKIKELESVEKRIIRENVYCRKQIVKEMWAFIAKRNA